MILETAAFGEDGAEDPAQAGRVEGPGVALEDGVQDSGFAGFVGYGQAVFELEAGDFSHGLGPAVDEAEKFKIKFVNHGALLLKGLSHGVALLD
jgi:hypothetical protein